MTKTEEERKQVRAVYANSPEGKAARLRYLRSDTRKASRNAWEKENRYKSYPRSRTRRQENRALCAAIKIDAGCIDCGYNEHAVALDFDHINDKRNDIARLYAAAEETLLAEIAKCVVRCSNCHRVKTDRNR